MHGKNLTQLSDLLDQVEDPPEIWSLQELGGLGGLPEGEVETIKHKIGGAQYVVYALNAAKSFRCTAVALREDVPVQDLKVETTPIGPLVSLRLQGRRFHVASLHWPHSLREDSVEVWKNTVEALYQALRDTRFHDVVLLGADVNQDMLQVDTFEGMPYLRSFMIAHGLDHNQDVGDTWQGRGWSSRIDYWLYRAPALWTTFHLRPDLKQALPSDHAPLFARNKCGRWVVQGELVDALHDDVDFVFTQDTFADACQQCSYRMPSLRYKDPPHILEVIRRRKCAQNPQERAALMEEIRSLRGESRAAHKVALLEKAKSGDRAPIAFLRRQAQQGASEVTYVRQAGGELKAAAEMQKFYEHKYADPAPQTSLLLSSLQPHADADVVPIKGEEVVQALDRVKKGTASGMDGVVYEAVRSFCARDQGEKVAAYFTRVLRGVPASGFSPY